MIANKSILVSGASGQLGKSFRDYFEKIGYSKVVYLTKTDLDICDAKQISSSIKENQPDVWINCAAYTNVDGAEDNKGTANKINGESLLHLGKQCEKNNVLLVHFSTDYVFDGASSKPYLETDKTSPINEYGASKLLGEQNIIKSNCDHFVIRSSWVYSPYGKNFLKSMILLGKERDNLYIVSDQIASPTYAKHLVETSLILMEKYFDKATNIASGVYHFTNEGECSWNDFAKAIFQWTEIDCTVQEITTKEFGAKADRPLYSKLECSKIKLITKRDIPHWKEALQECIKELDQ